MIEFSREFTEISPEQKTFVKCLELTAPGRLWAGYGERSSTDRFETIACLYSDQIAAKPTDQSLVDGELSQATNRIGSAVLAKRAGNEPFALFFEHGDAITPCCCRSAPVSSGHSLKVTQVVSRVRAKIATAGAGGSEMPLQYVLKYSTFAQLANLIGAESRRSRAARASDRLVKRGTKRLGEE